MKRPWLRSAPRTQSSSMPALLHDDGAVSLIPSFSDVTQSDTVGMNALVPFHYEGTPLPPFDASNTDRAYSRVGTDTNDNSRDFIMRAEFATEQHVLRKPLIASARAFYAIPPSIHCQLPDAAGGVGRRREIDH